MPPYGTGIKCLLMANTPRVYPDNRGTNYAGCQGEEVVSALLGEFGQSAPRLEPRFSAATPA